VQSGTLIGAAEIAEYLGYSRRRVYYLLSRGLLPPAYRVGQRWYLRKSAWRRFVGQLERGRS